ncbi:MAG: PorP/SprF family type IX secretion system membrane protein [Thermoflexibacter sp.]|jgi:type IX secretion system PorP/SprF family membrane protein|nr:PorP/SprF family type IX secretion system membrane protein [Thermoflexibacter sp.]
MELIKRKIFIITFLLLIILEFASKSAYSQETSLFTQYHQNKYFYNPAYAGYHGYSVAHLVYRKQWSGIEGAPETMLFSFQSPFSKNMGMGARIYRDNTGVVSRTGAQASYAYGVKFDDDNQLHFGLSIGTLVNSVRWELLSGSDLQDQALYRLNNSFVVDGAFGAYYNFKGLELSFAFPQLFNRSLREENLNSNSAFRYINQSVAAVSYRFDLIDSRLSLTPMVLHRFGSFAIQRAGQFDFSVVADWQESFWLSFLHRTDYGNAINAGIHLGQFSFGYAYEFANNRSLIGNVSNGSHEVLVSYHFGRKKDKKKPQPEDKDIDNQILAKEDSTIRQEVAQLDTASTPSVDSSAVTKVEEPKTTEDTTSTATDKQVFEKPEVGKRYVVQGLYFATGSAQIEKESFPALDNLVDFLRKNPTLKIEIGGHTDNVGNKATNQRLSENRAKAVMDYLAGIGVDKSRIVFKGYGDTQPIASNDDEKDGRELNRRIEMKVIE